MQKIVHPSKVVAIESTHLHFDPRLLWATKSLVSFAKQKSVASCRAVGWLVFFPYVFFSSLLTDQCDEVHCWNLCRDCCEKNCTTRGKVLSLSWLGGLLSTRMTREWWLCCVCISIVSSGAVAKRMTEQEGGGVIIFRCCVQWLWHFFFPSSSTSVLLVFTLLLLFTKDLFILV